MLGKTLAASFIWGINTIFLLDAGLSNLEAFGANAVPRRLPLLWPSHIASSSVSAAVSMLRRTVRDMSSLRMASIDGAPQVQGYGPLDAA
jgi:hypothetical protein